MLACVSEVGAVTPQQAALSTHQGPAMGVQRACHAEYEHQFNTLAVNVLHACQYGEALTMLNLSLKHTSLLLLRGRPARAWGWHV